MKFWTREEWYKVQPADLWESNCPFCNTKDIEEYTIWKWRYFYIAHSKYPHCWIKSHLLVIPHRHITETSKLTHEEFASMKEVEKFMKDYFKNEENYFSFIRETSGWKSIAHLHYHFLPGKIHPSWIENMLAEQQKERT